MTETSRRKMMRAARRPVDVVIRNARLVNVFTGQVIATDIAVAHGCVVGFNACPAERTIDLKGRFVAPGFIDAHVHVESAMVCPSEFARAVLVHGTTAVVADPHEIANVLGTAGITYMLNATADSPVGFYFSLPSCVPATTLESSGAVLAAEDLAPFMTHERIAALGEMMDFPGVVRAAPGVLAKIRLARLAGKPVDGHAPGLCGAYLNAYLSAGITSDHECTTAAEARAKLAAGMHIMVREGSGARNLDTLLPAITRANARRMLWCTDDRNPHDILSRGHIDGMVRRAVRAGLDPVIAIQMATSNPAGYFHLTDMGALAPGRRADLVVMDHLADPVVRQVYVQGRLVAEDGRLTDSPPSTPCRALPQTMNVAPGALDFAVLASGRRVRVIEVVPDQLHTRAGEARVCIRNNLAVSDPTRDILKIAVVERHRGTGSRSVGFVRGFGLGQGALASSVAHDSHNIVVVGVADADLRLAVETIIGMGGGLAVTAHGQVLAQLPLPIAGLMSDQPIETVCSLLEALTSAAHRLGVRLAEPFMTLSFMALPVIPALKITDRGLVDVVRGELVPLFFQ
jgi:adenine deaminase